MYRKLCVCVWQTGQIILINYVCNMCACVGLDMLKERWLCRVCVCKLFYWLEACLCVWPSFVFRSHHPQRQLFAVREPPIYHIQSNGANINTPYRYVPTPRCWLLHNVKFQNGLKCLLLRNDHPLQAGYLAPLSKTELLLRSIYAH